MCYVSLEAARDTSVVHVPESPVVTEFWTGWIDHHERPLLVSGPNGLEAVCCLSTKLFSADLPRVFEHFGSLEKFATSSLASITSIIKTFKMVI